MITTELYPLKFRPLYQEKIWGGRNLETILGRKLNSSHIGESWEICDRGRNQTLVDNGAWAGQTLHDVMTRLGISFLGNQFHEIPEQFPLLFKIIDAEDDLSIQVHPNDEEARKYKEKDSGKTEMWYVLNAGLNSKVYCGLKNGIRPEQLREKLSDSFPHCLNIYETRPGDVFFIPAGTVHALGKGNLVIEIQENSDITYRLSDWGRLGSDGKPRPLHIQQGLEVTQFQPHIKPFYLKCGDRPETLISCPYFEVKETNADGAYSEMMSRNSFQVWIFVQGEGVLNGVSYQKGDFILLPAHIGKIGLSAKSSTKFLKAFVPPKKV